MNIAHRLDSQYCRSITERTLYVFFGCNVTARRRANHLSLEDLAWASGLSAPELNEIELGNGGAVDFDSLRKLAAALDVEMYELFV